jgi:hypothetical protein
MNSMMRYADFAARSAKPFCLAGATAVNQQPRSEFAKLRQTVGELACHLKLLPPHDL